MELRPEDLIMRPTRVTPAQSCSLSQCYSCCTGGEEVSAAPNTHAHAYTPSMSQQHLPCRALAPSSQRSAAASPQHTNLEDAPQLPHSSVCQNYGALARGRTQQRAEEAGRRKHRGVVHVEQPLERQADGDGRGAEQDHEHRGRRADLSCTRRGPVSRSVRAEPRRRLREAGEQGPRDVGCGMKGGGPHTSRGATTRLHLKQPCFNTREAAPAGFSPQAHLTRGS